MSEPGLEAFVPVPVTEFELSGIGEIAPANSKGQRSVLIRLHGIPLGVLDRLHPDGADEPDLLDEALESFGPAIRDHLERDRLDSIDLVRATGPESSTDCHAAVPDPLPRTSVVVCSLGEDPRLVRTVHSILNQSHPDLELIVVDNQPASGEVRRLLAAVADPRLRIVDEPRRGLSVARNAGLTAASSALVAYTDDDAYADPHWLRHLLVPFTEHPEVVCVTGLVLPAEISTPAQLWFEEFGAFDKGFDRVVWSAEPSAELAELGRFGDRGTLFPYSAGVFGSGNNMAFRTSWLERHGRFDAALGAGTRVRGGEDLDAFLSVILAGGAIVYEPRALVRHHARSDLAALGLQMYGYGSGMSAVIAKHFLASPASALGIIRRLPAGVRRLLDPASPKNESKSTGYPRDLARAELRGYAAGPVLYAKSRREARRRGLYAPAAAVPRGRTAP